MVSSPIPKVLLNSATSSRLEELHKGAPP